MLVDGSASNRTTLLAKRLPVHVLPHALGPSTATAGDDLNASTICWSTTRGLYPAGTVSPISIPQIIPERYRKKILRLYRKIRTGYAAECTAYARV